VPQADAVTAPGPDAVTGARRQRRQRRQATRRRPFQVTLSVDERELLAACAGEQGVSLARLLVQSAVDRAQGRVPGDGEQQYQQLADRNETRHQLAAAAQELAEIRRLLATVANNVNQLAKMANIGGDTEVQALLAELRQWSASDGLDGLPTLLEGLRAGPRATR
jgi:hypothetical protein